MSITRYNRYSEVMNKLRHLNEDDHEKTANEASTELVDILKKYLPNTINVYVDPQIERGDIVVIEHAGYTFELLLKK